MKSIIAAALVAAGTASASEMVDLGENRETTKIIVPLERWSLGPNSITLDFNKPIYARGEFQIGMLSYVNAGITFLGDMQSWLIVDGISVPLAQPQQLVSPGALWIRDLLDKPAVFEGIRFDFTMPPYAVLSTTLVVLSDRPFGVGSVPESGSTLVLMAFGLFVAIVLQRQPR